MQTCTKCNKDKSPSEFYTRKDRPSNRKVCRQCHGKATKKYKSENAEKCSIKHKKYMKYWNANRTEAQKRKSTNSRLKNQYGISLNDYEDMKNRQHDKCAICGNIPKETLQVDHCHKTGLVRGLLCRGCNSGIGGLRDNVDILKSAIEYLEQNKR